MKTNSTYGLLAASLWVVLLGGCASSVDAPRIEYPVTYQIPVSNTQVSADTGGQNLNVVARQRVEVFPGRRLYFRVSSPVDVTMRVYAGDEAPRGLVAELHGADFTSSVSPDVDKLEFTFGVTEANSSGVVQFTLSDRPLPAAVAHNVPPR